MEKENLISLVKQAQQSDPQALNDLFTETYNDVYYFALKTVKNETLAKDITQETFITIFQNIDSLNDPVAYPAWSRQITYRHCLQYIKKQDKEVLVEEDEDGNSIFDTVQEDRTEFIPDEALDKEDFKKTILDMVDGLPEEQRTAIILYYYDELSVKQIAEIQGVTEGTVKSRLNYGRKAIKASVENYEKKHNIKLHSFAIFPFMLWLLGGQAKNCKMSASAVKAVAGSITTATKTAVTLPSIAVKATMALWQKVVAGIVAAAIAVGGGIAIANHPREEEHQQQVSSGSANLTGKELPLVSVTGYEDEDYKLEITAVGLTDEFPRRLEIWYTIENHTTCDIVVMPEYVVINGLSCRASKSVNVPAGQTVASHVVIVESLDGNDIQEVSNGVLALLLEEWPTPDGHNDFNDKRIIKLQFTTDTDYTQPLYTDGQIIYENNGLKIISQGCHTQKWAIYGHYNHRFYVENTTDRVFVIDIIPRSPSGEWPAHAIPMDCIVDAGSSAYIYANTEHFLQQYRLQSTEFFVSIREVAYPPSNEEFSDTLLSHWLYIDEFYTDPLPVK